MARRKKQHSHFEERAMKLLLKNISKFFIILYGSIITLLLISNHFINKNADFKLDKKTYHIVLGNSQPECAFNDSLISNFKNLAKSGESYFYNKKVLILFCLLLLFWARAKR